ncbi:MAG: sulfurtransferase [Gemmatimonadaceae bacterium]
MKPLVSATELKELLAHERAVLLDARSGPGARARYDEAHLPGAQFVDLDEDLARRAANPAHGGRHPLPPIADFGTLLGKLGIARDTHVIAYDDKSGANAAARVWWMLRAVGHADVQVLDGGLQAATAAGIPMRSGAEARATAAPYPVSAWQLPTASAHDVERASREGSALIVDVREAPRYRGEVEPIDLVAGHIPGAENLPFAGNLASDGRFLAPETLRSVYEAFIGVHAPADVVVHCGSGVTACHTLLGFAHAGLPIPKLYVGSWSEWSRNDHPDG